MWQGGFLSSKLSRAWKIPPDNPSGIITIVKIMFVMIMIITIVMETALEIVALRF